MTYESGECAFTTESQGRRQNPIYLRNPGTAVQIFAEPDVMSWRCIGFELRNLVRFSILTPKGARKRTKTLCLVVTV